MNYRHEIQHTCTNIYIVVQSLYMYYLFYLVCVIRKDLTTLACVPNSDNRTANWDSPYSFIELDYIVLFLHLLSSKPFFSCLQPFWWVLDLFTLFICWYWVVNYSMFATLKYNYVWLDSLTVLSVKLKYIWIDIFTQTCIQCLLLFLIFLYIPHDIYCNWRSGNNSTDLKIK